MCTSLMANQASQHNAGQRPATAANPGSAGGLKNITRNNGVAFQANEHVAIQSYINSIAGTIIPAKDIVSASRISNGRIAIYLSSKEAVTHAVQQGLEYEGALLELTPLVRPTTRIILSNVYPEIPNEILTDNLTSFCKVVSDLRPIPLGFKDKRLNHIMSFRRHVQVLMKPNVILPDHINFSYNGMNYRVFLSTESMRCFNCGEFGHISRSCKKPAPKPNVPTTNPQPPQSIVTDPPVITPLAPPPKESVRTQSTPSRPTTSNTTNVTGNTISNPNKSPTHTDMPSKASPPKSSAATNLSPVWKTPPALVRTFSEVVSKRKQHTPDSGEQNSTLTTLKAPSPSRKIARKASPSQAVTIESPTPSRKIAGKASASQTVTVDSPTLTQALDSQPPNIPSTPSSSVVDTDTDSMTWEDAQSEEEALKEDSLPLTQGPLSQSEIVTFLSNVKGRKKPGKFAQKYTTNIPGLVKQLKPLKNSPLVKRNMQQRIYKLINSLEK